MASCSIYDMPQSTFWNKLQELTLHLRTSEDAFKLLNKIKEEDERKDAAISSIYSVSTTTDKETILRSIEGIVLKFLNDVTNGSLPKFTLNKRGSYENTKYTEGRGIEMLTDVTNHEISLEHGSSLRKYAIIMNCLSVCYKLLQTGKHSTKRDIYYSNVNFFQNQHVVDEAISDISCMLGVPRHSLNVLSSSKGFIGGDLRFKDADNNLIKCAVNEGIQIPSYINALHNFESNAKFILVIEKEATYQRLMEYKLSQRMGPCILMTEEKCWEGVIVTSAGYLKGKGFPDVNTRMLLRKLWETLHIPILALMDADPHGIEIMCIYKYGSKSLSHEASYLTCPPMKWIGIQPKDIDIINIKEHVLIPFTDGDLKRANELLRRPYILKNDKLLEQINILIKRGKKAEIECLDSMSRSFMTDIYLPQKIRTGDWL